jgi:hypothetical protein
VLPPSEGGILEKNNHPTSILATMHARGSALWSIARHGRGGGREVGGGSIGITIYKSSSKVAYIKPSKI